jgi:poly-gamma-glutamate synthesis protein (capsule biosynthesis protein)
MHKRIVSMSCIVVVITALFVVVRSPSLFATASGPGRTHSVFATSSFDGGDATLLFVGDMFFDRYIRKMARLHGEEYLFSCSDDLLRSVDAVVGNLEGPITDEGSTSEDSLIGSPENYRFTFPSTTASLLARHNINIVDLGNNHIANFGSDGIKSTHRYLGSAGVGYFGGVVGDEPVLERVIGGVPFAFISYNAFSGSPAIEVAARIKDERQKRRIVIVFAHWGEEYSTSTTALRERATLFAQSGASLIVGAHPHVVLPSEVIGRVPVYYSLGNFIFDQYWNSSVSSGLALEVSISDDGLALKEHYVEILRDGRSCVR